MKKYLSLIIGLSSILTAAYFIICLTDPEFNLNTYIIVSVIFVSLWIFFVIPAYRYYYLMHLRMVKEGEDTKLHLSFMFYKISMLLPLIFAPAYGLMYYINAMRSNE